MELTDYSKKYPNKSSIEIAKIQSTFCICGNAKEIGEETCGHGGYNCDRCNSFTDHYKLVGDESYSLCDNCRE